VVAADRQGYRLIKSRIRDPRAVIFDRYNLLDIQTGFSVLNIPDPLGHGYPADISDIENFLTENE
jgi:hypothetical protein